MKHQFLLLIMSVVWLQSFSQTNPFDLHHKYDSLFRSECLDVFEENRLIVLYDSLLNSNRQARLAALDTITGITEQVKKSYEFSIKSEADDKYLQLAALANSNGLTIAEQKMISAQQKCISQFEQQEPFVSFTFDPDKKSEFDDLYKDLNNNTTKYIPSFEPVWVNITFGKKQHKSLEFRAEWNEENTDIVTISPPEGCQICDFSFSDDGSRGNFLIEEGKSFVFDDPSKQTRVIKLILDISSTGSFEFYDRWSSNAKLSKVKLNIMPYYYDEAQRIKYNCYVPERKRVIKNTAKYHQAQMAYDPKNTDGTNIILKD